VKLLVTGVAGFIGFHTARFLLARGEHVVGVDNMNDYYDPAIKHARLALLSKLPGFRFIQQDLADRTAMEKLFATEKFQRVIHLAAQAGVRYSLTNPQAYIDANLVGFTNILEGCRQTKVEHLVYASSSSVYGLNGAMPFSVHDNVDHPVSLYAATKKANELMAHSYSHLFALPMTGLRFFTVYGPWGRPDMALFKFTKAILAGEPIDVFNHGKMRRDFTYIDDIVEGVVRTCDHVAKPNPAFDPLKPDPATSSAPWRIYNIGNHQPVESPPPSPTSATSPAKWASLPAPRSNKALPILSPGTATITKSPNNPLDMGRGVSTHIQGRFIRGRSRSCSD
jgi:UDP-glucuronate 4-epimerase